MSLSDEQYEELKKYYEELSKRDIFFIEVPGTAKEIAESIYYYWSMECKQTGHTLVYEIDHALLTKGMEGQSEKARVDELMFALVLVKKRIASEGGHSVGIVLSQMNRDIRSIERRHNADLHRPDTSCLFGASSIEQCSDYILFSHIPATLGLVSYTDNKLPTRIQIKDKVMQMAYFELVKQRSGESNLTIPMWNKLDRFNFEEMDSELFKALMQAFALNDYNGIIKYEWEN